MAWISLSAIEGRSTSAAFDCVANDGDVISTTALRAPDSLFANGGASAVFVLP
jgi:hypothetical protein